MSLMESERLRKDARALERFRRFYGRICLSVDIFKTKRMNKKILKEGYRKVPGTTSRALQ